jgi:hypothetical protein
MRYGKVAKFRFFSFSSVHIAHKKKAQRQAGFLRYPPLGLVAKLFRNQTFLRNMP